MADETLPDDEAPLREHILDQEEVDDALGFRLPDREPEGDARAMLDAGAAPRERMPMLPIVFDDLCGRLSLSLRELLGKETTAAVEGLVPRRYADVIDDIVLPAQLVTFSAEGWAGHGLLVIGPDLATLALDTLLGAGAAEGGQPLTRPFSEIETAILGRIADVVLGETEAAFREVLPVSLRQDRIESDPRLVAIARPGEVVLSASLRLSIDGRCGRVSLALPFATLEPARAALRSPFMGAKSGPADPWAVHLATEAWQSTLEMEAVLHETRLPLRQVLALAIGDTLMFEMRPSDLVEVRCGGLPVTRGHIGRVDGRIAVQVVEPVARPRALHAEGLIP